MSLKTEVLAGHAFPANLTDMTAKEDQDAWSKNYISKWMGDEIKGGGEGPGGIIRTPLTQFFDGTVTPFDVSQDPVSVHWNAFPNRVQTWFGSSVPLRWQIADSSRMFQDEYLEWSVMRDGKDQMDFTSNITSATFTCEGPEYWSFLAERYPDLLLEIYNERNPDYAGKIKATDLFLDPDNKKFYNQTNWFNLLSSSGSIAHLIHPANTLGAEIDIASQATVIRKDATTGKTITDQDKLIKCSQYGNPFRNSDPVIGGSVNEVCRGGQSVTVSDPVALYMKSFDTSHYQLDYSGIKDGSQLKPVPPGVFSFTRGDISKNRGLRLEVRIPAGLVGTVSKKPLTVSDIYDSASPADDGYIRFAAQFADRIEMHVSVYQLQTPPAPPDFCPGAVKRTENAEVSHMMSANAKPRPLLVARHF